MKNETFRGDGFLFSVGDGYECTCGKAGPKSELKVEDGVIMHPPLKGESDEEK